MTKLIFFDIDGTLVTQENRIPDSTMVAIGQLKKKGHIPVLSTGRPPKMLANVAKKLGISSFISLNGQYIVAEGKEIYTKSLSNKIITPLIETSYQKGDRTFLLTKNDVIGNTFMKELMDPEFLSLVYSQINGTDPVVQNELFKRTTEKPLTEDRYKDEEVLAAFIHTMEENDDYYREAFPKLHFTRAAPIFAEVLLQGTHKATGMKILADYFGISKEETIAFGDSLNDLEMIQTANIGVAMGNGRDELKAVADMTTSTVDADGIYKGLRKLQLIS